MDHFADLAIVFEPVGLNEVQVLARVRQQVHAVPATDHPLAHKSVLRLGECAQFPVGLPTAPYGVRHLIDRALMGASSQLDIAIGSDNFEFLRRYATKEHLVTFQIPIGLPLVDGIDDMIARPVDTRDIPEDLLYLRQLRGPTLPVAAAKFAVQLEKVFATRFD